MFFNSIVRAGIFSILLLGVTNNGWGGYRENDFYMERIPRRNTAQVAILYYEETEYENSYNQRPISTLRCVINAINWLVPPIIVLCSAYFAYLKETEDKS